MSLLLPIALATSVSGPVAGQRPWLTTDDFPDRALSGEMRGSATIRLLVDSTGKPVTCMVEKETGEGRFGADACKTALRRARFTPAQDANGTPIFGVIRRIANYWLPDGKGSKGYPIRLGPDLGLRVANSAGTSTPPTVVRVGIVVSAAGAIESCTAGIGETLSEAAKLACAEIGRGYKPDQIKAQGGGPVRYAQSLTIAFIPPEG
jgi:hypothetical protein